MQRRGILVVTVGLALAGGPAARLADASHTRAKNPVQLPPPVDADTLPKGSSDANWVLRWLGDGKYALLIQNTSGIGYLNTFEWVPPPGVTITAVTSTTGGKCGLDAGNISCAGPLKPPTCTCLPGGEMTVYFTATGLENKSISGDATTYYGVEASYLVIKTVTPVPYHIPSYISSKNL